MAKHKHKVALYAVLLNSLGYIATEIYLPSLPAIESYFKTTEALVQLTIFSFLLSFACSPILFGPLSDKVGRKKVIQIGLWIGLAASVSCALASSMTQLILARFCQGLGMGALVVASRAMLPDTFTGKDLNKTSSLMAMTIPIFVACAPIFGGFIEHYASWRHVFIVLSIYSVLVMLATFGLNETHTKLNTKAYYHIFKHYGVLIRDSHFMAYVICMIIPMIGMLGYLTAGPFLFQNVVGLNPAEFGLLSIVNAAMIILMGFVNSKLIDYFAPETVLLIAICLMTLAGLGVIGGLYFQVPLFWVILVPSALYICAIPLVYANAGQRAYQIIGEHFGLASAMIACVQFVGGMIGTIIFVLIEDIRVLPLGLCYLGCAFTLSICVWGAHRMNKRHADASA